jgi:hypothetical protein
MWVHATNKLLSLLLLLLPLLVVHLWHLFPLSHTSMWETPNKIAMETALKGTVL